MQDPTKTPNGSTPPELRPIVPGHPWWSLLAVVLVGLGSYLLLKP